MLRPQRLLTEFSKKYPKCWQQLDMFIADKGQDLPDWPEWCFVPIAVTHAIVSAQNSSFQEFGPDMATMQALAGWRLTQGVYRFSPELYRSICATPLEDKLPAELWKRPARAGPIRVKGLHLPRISTGRTGTPSGQGRARSLRKESRFCAGSRLRLWALPGMRSKASWCPL